MMLHDNKEEFKNIINYVANANNILPQVLEKDYYVSLILKELSDMQYNNNLPIYFKGGTCLYKIYEPMKRFSEDIDLTVDAVSLSKNQAKCLLEKSTNKYVSLTRLKGDAAEENRKGSITTIYKYDSVFDTNKADELQRYEKVKIESTSFTVSEPFEENYIEPLIMSLLPEKQKQILTEKFEVLPFKIKNISLERIFVDKLLATEFYFERNMLFDVAKHIYDIYIMKDKPAIKSLIANEELFVQMLSYKRIEETLRIGSVLDTKPLADFNIFNIDFNKMIEILNNQYTTMSNIYILNQKDNISLDTILKENEGLFKKIKAYSQTETNYRKTKEYKDNLLLYNPSYFTDKLHELATISPEINLGKANNDKKDGINNSDKKQLNNESLKGTLKSDYTD